MEYNNLAYIEGVTKLESVYQVNQGHAVSRCECVWEREKKQPHTQPKVLHTLMLVDSHTGYKVCFANLCCEKGEKKDLAFLNHNLVSKLNSLPQK